jgi:hypothetical protein
LIDTDKLCEVCGAKLVTDCVGNTSKCNIWNSLERLPVVEDKPKMMICPDSKTCKHNDRTGPCIPHIYFVGCDTPMVCELSKKKIKCVEVEG